ncbi:hypothetical protein ACROYT_G030155 [Oculina patagonica]
MANCLIKSTNFISVICTKEAIAITLADTYQRLYELPDPKLPVKYPRTPGYRPSAEENPYNAWYWRCDIEGATNGKLKGKTLAIKDNVCVAGVPMMNGSRVLEGFVPDVDATAVSRILDAGGRILGKAVCENLCFDGASFTSATGPVLNPYDVTEMAGGSSAGCAALVSGGHVDMALGGDQGCSIRAPASYCGIVGLKPTHGLVPYTGVMPLDMTIDHVGPMARTVYDVALLLEVIAGFDDGLDARQSHDLQPSLSYTEQLTGNISGVKIGLVKEGFGHTGAEHDVEELVRQAASCIQSRLGAKVEDVSIPMHLDGPKILSGIYVEGSTRMMFEGGGFGTSAKMYYDTVLQQAFARGLRTHGNDLPVTCKQSLLLGRYLLSEYNGYFYSKSQNLARGLCKAYDRALQDYEVLLMPTVPRKAQALPLANMSMTEYTEKAFNHSINTSSTTVTGHPAMSINVGFSSGLPVGMMIIGKKFQEATLLNVAFAYENIRDSVNL